MGQGHNSQYGEAVLSNFLMLQYVTPNMMANLFDCFNDATGGRKKSQKLITPRGRKEMFRAVKKDIQGDFREDQIGREHRELEMSGTIRRRIFEDVSHSGSIELAVHKSDEVKEIVTKDLDIINGILGKRLPGSPELDIQDIGLRIPVFTIDEAFRSENIEIERPLIPMAPVTFQPLGIHEIPSF